MAYRYAREKLSHAVYLLAIGKGDIRSRLQSTYRDLRAIGPNRLPAALRRELESVKLSMKKFGPMLGPGGGVYKNSMQHTMTRIRNSTGSQIAKRIYSLYGKLRP